MSPEENKAVVRRWFAETDKGNDDIIDELCAPDYVDHNPPVPGVPEGSAGVHRANEVLRAAFPDTVHTIEAQIAEGDMVVTRLRARATFTGDFQGLQPTGRAVEIGGIIIHRLKDGKLAEHWANIDNLGFMQQLGAIPSLAAPNP